MRTFATLCQIALWTVAAPVVTAAPQVAPPSADRPDAKAAPLRTLDKRLQSVLPDSSGKLSFEVMRRRIGKATSLKIATTEVEIAGNTVWAVLRDANVGDTMEAYALLYRMRWVRYRTGSPDYELTTASDVADSLHQPQSDSQKKRFAAMDAFFKTLDGDMRSDLFAGKPVPLAAMPPGARAPLVEAVQALLDGTSANQPLAAKPDLRNLADVVVSLRDESKPSDGFQNLWVGIESNLGGFAFRWNDHRKGDAPVGSGRPYRFVHEPPPNERYSRRKMVDDSPLCAKPVRIEAREWKLEDLLRHIAGQMDVDILADVTSPPPARVAVDGQTFAKAMDAICEAFGELQWEVLHDRFLVLRASDNPRRRP